MTADLYPRIRAAIEERLELARAATPGPWEHVDHGPGGMFMGCGQIITWGKDVEAGLIAAPAGDCYARSGYSPKDDMAFIAANHPAWAIRALEADLERLDRHVPQGWGEDTIRRHPAVTDERWCAWCADRALAWPCPEVFALARVYLEEEA